MSRMQNRSRDDVTSTGGTGLFASGKGTGVVAEAAGTSGVGLSAAANGHDSAGVQGVSDLGYGTLGFGGTTGVGVGGRRGLGALQATNISSGRALLATDTNPSDLALGGPGTGTAVAALLKNVANASDAVVASTAGTGSTFNATATNTSSTNDAATPHARARVVASTSTLRIQRTRQTR